MQANAPWTTADEVNFLRSLRKKNPSAILKLEWLYSRRMRRWDKTVSESAVIDEVARLADAVRADV